MIQSAPPAENPNTFWHQLTQEILSIDPISTARQVKMKRSLKSEAALMKRKMRQNTFVFPVDPHVRTMVDHEPHDQTARSLYLENRKISILNCVETRVHMRLQEGIYQTIRDLPITDVELTVWRFLFPSDLLYQTRNTLRSSRQNGVWIGEPMEHVSFNICTGFPKLTTPLWYIKTFQTHNGQWKRFIVHRITFSYNLYTHMLSVSFSFWKQVYTIYTWNFD